MTLAARYRHWPVLLGATTAFPVLNALAVILGAFGIHALLKQDDGDTEDVKERVGHGIYLSTLLLILVAEFGDKTQIAVASLAGTLTPLPVWFGASAALITVSAPGILAGRTLLQHLSIIWPHRLSGGIFLLFAAFAGWRILALGGS